MSMKAMGPWTVVGVPIYTLAGYRGMGDAPAALLGAGLLDAMGAKADSVALPRLTKDVVEGKVKNLSHFRKCTSLIYETARSVQTEKAVVLGGECSETVGAMAGLVEAFGGEAGMLWLDAHGDFNTPETSPSGYIGGMCLAMATGRGPGFDVVPPLADERLVHVGSRALDSQEAEAFRTSRAKLVPARAVKKEGAAVIARQVAKQLYETSDWIACHLDLDVIDPELVPAVNYPTPDGLSFDEVATIVRALSKNGRLRVLELAAYNAAKDRDGASAKKIVGLVNRIIV